MNKRPRPRFIDKDGRAHYISGFDTRVLKSCTAYLAATMFKSLCRR
jgi:hypothetical protein